MKLTDELKKQIDSMDYESMLHKWRFTPCEAGSLFEGESGDYFKTVMFEKKDDLPEGEAVAVSKQVGWEKR
jgi:hypothetical protein